jgi:beta-galactosidase
VYLCKTQALHVAAFGTYITTPVITENMAEVQVDTRVLGAALGQPVRLETEIIGADGLRAAIRQADVP